MNRFLLFPTSLAVVFTLLEVMAHAEAPQEAKRSIQSRYAQLDRAYMKKDFKSVTEVFATECVLKLNSEGRTMKATRMIKGMEALSKSLTLTHVKTQVLSIKATKTGEEVASAWTADSAYVPANKSKEDPARRSKVKQTVRDMWKKTDKGWQITARIIEDSDDDKQPKANK